MKKEKRKKLRRHQKEDNAGRTIINKLSNRSISQGALELQQVLDLVDGEGESTQDPFFIRGIRKEYKDFLWDMTPKGRAISFTLNVLIGRVKAAHDRKCLRKPK